MKSVMNRLNIDPYIVLLLTMVALASLLPARGMWAGITSVLADAGIVLLFFLHGARLSRQAVIGGIRHWRLHATVGLVTYVVFPALGLIVRSLPFVDPALGTGFLFLTLLPSTVQSSIAFTAIAQGNVAAAVCSASLSNLAGILLTPLLVSVFITQRHGELSGDAGLTIALQLLLPFATGHLLRPWIGDWIGSRKKVLTLVDRGSILLVVYVAFSAAVVGGLWSRVDVADLLTIGGISIVLLGTVLAFTYLLGKWFKFDRADAIVLQFCGSKKSLASGVPMAGALFPASQVGVLLLPLMFFHQIQLMACAVLARRYGDRAERVADRPANASPSAG